MLHRVTRCSGLSLRILRPEYQDRTATTCPSVVTCVSLRNRLATAVRRNLRHSPLPPGGPPIPGRRGPRRKETSMLRTARLTDAMRAHGKSFAVSAVAAGALAAAGGASAVLTSGPTPLTGHLAASHAAGLSHHSAVTTERLTGSGQQSREQSTAATQLLPIGHSAPTVKAPPANAPAPPPQPPAAPAPQPAPQPTTIYDSVTPSSIPAGAKAAVYSNGSYAASPSQVAGHANSLWIDTNGSNPKANALDVEPGDASPQQAATWVQQKLTATPNQTAIVYTMLSQWDATKQAISALPPQIQSHVK